MMSVKLHKYRIVTIYYQSELSGGHCRSAATMPLHVVCRGEECRSVTAELSGGHCRSTATMPLHVVCRGEECRSVTSVRQNGDGWTKT